MHVYFSGISGAAIGPLSIIAKQAGFTVSGSDKQDSLYIPYLAEKGVTNVHIGQTTEKIAAVHAKKPIDWLVYSSSVIKENPNHPELLFAKENNITCTKRSDFITELLQQTKQQMVAIAGTHGKTTTTAMTIWLFKQLGVPASHSVGAKMPFGDMGHFNKDADYFIYEADEYDRNFLSYHPKLSMITGIDWDHPDIYPTRSNYNDAFREFLDQSHSTYLHKSDADILDVDPTKTTDSSLLGQFSLTGKVNRSNALLVAESISKLVNVSMQKCIEILNDFPGVSRRFECITDGLFTDYAHTPDKVRGAIDIAQEHISSNNSVSKLTIVYEGLHNTRQHFIKDDLTSLFEGIDELIIVPSYLAREDESLEMLTPEKLCQIVRLPNEKSPAELNADLKIKISSLIESGNLVLCLTAGGGGSLDEWLRAEFK